MRAIIQKKYGGLEVFQLQEVDKPQPKDDEVLVRIHAAGVNDWELGLMAGKPLFMRIFIGFFRPKIRIPGCEIAGVVESIGENVTRFSIGKKVYCDLSYGRFGAFADYVCVKESELCHMPTNMSFAQAAAIPHAGAIALQGLRDMAGLREGQTLLINGAGGGVGTLGLQYAKQYRCRVTGVDSKRKQDYMHLLSFDHVIDYEKEDFAQSGKQYDVILDNKSSRSPFDCAAALNSGGIYISVGGNIWRVLQCALFKKWIAWRHNKRIEVLGLKPNRGLDYLTGLVESGKILPAVDKRYPLEEAVEAIKRFQEAKHCGKIVVLVEDTTQSQSASAQSTSE